MDKIKYLYENTELTMGAIAAQVGAPYKRVFNYVKSNYSRQFRLTRKRTSYRNSKLGGLNPMFGKIGEAHPNFRYIVEDGKGYLVTLKPVWFTGRKGSKHIFIHHYVVAENLSLQSIPPGWHVHHCDCDTHNNAFDNLVLLTMSDHMRLHHFLEGATTISKESTLKWVEAHGTPFRREDIV